MKKKKKMKKGQIPNLKFDKIWLCEEDQHVKLWEKPWMYQVLKLR